METAGGISPELPPSSATSLAVALIAAAKSWSSAVRTSSSNWPAPIVSSSATGSTGVAVLQLSGACCGKSSFWPQLIVAVPLLQFTMFNATT
jgi:hypothetical protein